MKGPLLDPGLLLCLALVAAFAAVAWFRAYRLYRADRKWRDNIEALHELEEKRKADLVRRIATDPSSFFDDSPKGPLPETWRAPCGEPISLRTCETCGLIVIHDACGQPWARAHSTTGFHLRCGHGYACHPPALARLASLDNPPNRGPQAA